MSLTALSVKIGQFFIRVLTLNNRYMTRDIFDMDRQLYEVICWPDIQDYMNKEGFEDNAYLINDEKGMELFGSSAYFVNTEWADKVDSQDVLWKEISTALANTSEENHMKVNIIVSTPEDQGLSDNDKPVITEIWQHPTEGIVTFKYQGDDTEYDLSDYPEFYEQVANGLDPFSTMSEKELREWYDDMVTDSVINERY